MRRSARLRLVLVDHRPDELDLTGEITVVGSGLDTGSHQLAAVHGVGADGAADHPGVAHHVVEGGPIVAIGDDERQARRRRVDVGQTSTQRLELGAAAPPQRQPHFFGVRPLYQVLGHQAAGETGRAPEHDVMPSLLILPTFH